jgi:hypothetical protein
MNIPNENKVSMGRSNQTLPRIFFGCVIIIALLLLMLHGYAPAILLLALSLFFLSKVFWLNLIVTRDFVRVSTGPCKRTIPFDRLASIGWAKRLEGGLVEKRWINYFVFIGEDGRRLKIRASEYSRSNEWATLILEAIDSRSIPIMQGARTALEKTAKIHEMDKEPNQRRP